jgi:hypothetical protein
MFQKTLNRIGLFCIVTMLVVSAVACKKDNPLVGRWEEPGNSSHSLEFFQDGTVIRGEENATGNYKIVDDTHLRFDGWGGSVTFEFKISDDTLTLSDGQSTMQFKRVKKS